MLPPQKCLYLIHQSYFLHNTFTNFGPISAFQMVEKNLQFHSNRTHVRKYNFRIIFLSRRKTAEVFCVHFYASFEYRRPEMERKNIFSARFVYIKDTCYSRKAEWKKQRPKWTPFCSLRWRCNFAVKILLNLTRRNFVERKMARKKSNSVSISLKCRLFGHLKQSHLGRSETGVVLTAESVLLSEWQWQTYAGNIFTID